MGEVGELITERGDCPAETARKRWSAWAAGAILGEKVGAVARQVMIIGVGVARAMRSVFFIFHMQCL